MENICFRIWKGREKRREHLEIFNKHLFTFLVLYLSLLRKGAKKQLFIIVLCFEGVGIARVDQTFRDFQCFNASNAPYRVAPVQHDSQTPFSFLFLAFFFFFFFHSFIFSFPFLLRYFLTTQL